MKKSMLTAVLLSAFSFGAMAETPSFNFVEIGLTQFDNDDSSIEVDGFEFDFNYDFSENYYFSADYTDVEDGQFDSTLTNLGFGYKSEISNYSTVFSQIDWANIENNNGGDENGYRLGVGIRSNFTRDLELTAMYEYLDLDESSNIYTVGAAYKVSNDYSVYADYKNSSDVDQFSVGVRFNF